MQTEFIDDKNRKISVQFSKSEDVSYTDGEYDVPENMLGGTLYAGADGDVNLQLLDDNYTRVVEVKKGHTLYRIKKVIQNNTTVNELSIFS